MLGYLRAVAAYRTDFGDQAGKIGITLSISWKEPEKEEPGHLQVSGCF